MEQAFTDFNFFIKMVVILFWYSAQLFITFYFLKKIKEEAGTSADKYFSSPQFLRSKKLKFIVTIIALFVLIIIFLLEIYFDLERMIALQLVFILFAYLDHRSWKDLQAKYKKI
ncbi:MAG: hypothetical protein KBD26_03215 [Candidatus Pacebacteria bacterium]|nr:hypothetical protein [Candidatus Paceibacterota bacterium]MBP9772817.1 hypothetical protein [Candidatus Paceibacterota bacterium]